jgi:hypothetical protein
MMVVMLRNKVQMIHKPHGLFQTRMEQGAGKGGCIQRFQAIHQTESRRAEFGQNFY